MGVVVRDRHLQLRQGLSADEVLFPPEKKVDRLCGPLLVRDSIERHIGCYMLVIPPCRHPAELSVLPLCLYDPKYNNPSTVSFVIVADFM